MKAKTRSWSPEGFDRYREIFPETQSICIDGDLNKSAMFCFKWSLGVEVAAGNLESLAADTSIVFVRGFLGNFMPGNLTQPVKALRRLGFDSFILKNRAGADVKSNVSMWLKDHGIKGFFGVTTSKTFEDGAISHMLVVVGQTRGYRFALCRRRIVADAFRSFAGIGKRTSEKAPGTPVLGVQVCQ